MFSFGCWFELFWKLGDEFPIGLWNAEGNFGGESEVGGGNWGLGRVDEDFACKKMFEDGETCCNFGGVCTMWEGAVSFNSGCNDEISLPRKSSEEGGVS